MIYNFFNLKDSLKKIEDFLFKEYNQLNIGRASLAVLDGIQIESYGNRQPIKNIASIAIEDSKTLRISPWDKNQVKSIEKSILMADLGLSVASDDQGIRVIFPQLTTENRQKLIKVSKEKLEEARIAIRRTRGDVWEDIQKQKKEGVLTEDEEKRFKDELQKIIDEANKNLEKIFEKKEKDILG